MSGELPHIRCISCGKVLGDKYERYMEMVENGVKIEDALYSLGLTRPCCRIRLMNPFKTVQRGGTVYDNLSTTIDTQVPTEGALQSISSSSFTVIPEDEEIDLPDVEQIELPKMEEKGKQQIARTYKAW